MEPAAELVLGLALQAAQQVSELAAEPAEIERAVQSAPELEFESESRTAEQVPELAVAKVLVLV